MAPNLKCNIPSAIFKLLVLLVCIFFSSSRKNNVREEKKEKRDSRLFVSSWHSLYRRGKNRKYSPAVLALRGPCPWEEKGVIMRVIPSLLPVLYYVFFRWEIKRGNMSRFPFQLCSLLSSQKHSLACGMHVFSWQFWCVRVIYDAPWNTYSSR